MKNNQFPDLNNYNSNQQPRQQHHNENSNNSNSNNKNLKKAQQIEESVKQTFLRNMIISDEFMKWCSEQLNDFHVECFKLF